MVVCLYGRIYSIGKHFNIVFSWMNMKLLVILFIIKLVARINIFLCVSHWIILLFSYFSNSAIRKMAIMRRDCRKLLSCFVSINFLFKHNFLCWKQSKGLSCYCQAHCLSSSCLIFKGFQFLSALELCKYLKNFLFLLLLQEI